MLKKLILRYFLYQQYKNDIQTLSLLQESFKQDFNIFKQDFDFDIKFLSVDNISGNLYDILKVEDKKYFVIIVDVAGHGLYSAFFSIILKILFHYLIKTFNDIYKVFQIIIDIVLEYFDKQLVTCLLVKIDVANKTLEFYKAGHLAPLYYKFNENTYEFLKLKGKILCAKKFDLSLSALKIHYEPNDRIFLFTDGLTEIDIEIEQKNF